MAGALSALIPVKNTLLVLLAHFGSGITDHKMISRSAFVFDAGLLARGVTLRLVRRDRLCGVTE
jgi:hypothetical protein